MQLVTGGAFQGKLDFAKTLVGKSQPRILEGERVCREHTPDHPDIIAHFHLYVRGLLEQGLDLSEIRQKVEQLLLCCPEVILEVTELGCGIIPMDAFERRYQEAAGRISCLLAEKAEKVYRVNCGIGIKIKG